MLPSLLGLLLASPFALAAPPILIQAQSFGDAWPFVLKEMHLQCLPDKAAIITDPETGRMYRMTRVTNGKARQLGLRLDDILAESRSVPGAKASIEPVIEAGARLCN